MDLTHVNLSGGATLKMENPSAFFRSNGQERILCLEGDWSIHCLEKAQACLRAHQHELSLADALDMTGVTRLDTSGALVINQILHHPGAALPVLGDHHGFLDLLRISTLPELEDAVPAPQAGWAGVWLARFGRDVFTLRQIMRQRLSFFGFFVSTLLHSLLHPSSLRWTSLFYHMDQAGVRAIPIISLLIFLIGMVTAYMAAAQLVNFGAQIFVVKLLEVSIHRELAVLLTSILVAGRSGSSFTAQIGSMVANQEVDAMRSMGLAPMRMLVLPRVLALMLMLPMLVLIADVAGIFGGMMAVWVSMDITPRLFMETLQADMSLKHLFIGLFKAPFFAVIIGCTGCLRGFEVSGSAESVGRLTTISVVESIFLVIVVDALFALLFTSVGI